MNESLDSTSTGRFGRRVELIAAGTWLACMLTLALWAIWNVIVFSPFIATLGAIGTPFFFLMGRTIRAKST